MKQIKLSPIRSKHWISALAISIPGIFMMNSAIAEESSDNGIALEEILVTAAYREQSIQDIPTAIQVFDGSNLEALGAASFEDYLLTIPGTSFRDGGAGAKRIAIRGVSNLAGTDDGALSSVSTVGVYLDDIPVQGASLMPDIGLFDLNRIEVLRGPQGTLYGDGAMGGAVKMIFNEPDTEAVAGKVAMQISSTKGGDLNYRTDGAINIPLSDTTAVRFVAGAKSNSGFIDNLNTFNSGEDINSSDGFSIRGTLKSQLTDNLSVKFLALRDESNHDEFNQILNTLSDLEIDSGEERFTDYEIDLFGLTLKYDLGFAELTSVTSSYERQRNTADHSPDFGLLPAGANATLFPTTLVENLESVAQEFRLVSNGDNRTDWVLGLFYRERERTSEFSILAADVERTQIVNAITASGSGYQISGNGRYHGQDLFDNYEQFAVYGELNYELSENLELTLGLRWFDETVDNKSTVPNSILGNIFPPRIADTKDSGVVPKISLAYQATEEHLYYFTAAKGFRSSVINNNLTFGAGDEGADSDNLWNYEIGAKTSWANGRVTLNGALYYIDWSDIQITLNELAGLFPGAGIIFPYIENGGDATIKGAELELTAMPTDNLIIGASLGLIDSEVVSGERDVIEGANLPNTPEVTASSYARYDFPINDDLTGFVRASVEYVDEQSTLPITTTLSDPDGFALASHTTVDFRMGLEAENWSIDLFVDNATDERAEFGRGLPGSGSNLDPDRFTISRPRTIGLMFRTSF